MPGAGIDLNGVIDSGWPCATGASAWFCPALRSDLRRAQGLRARGRRMCIGSTEHSGGPGRSCGPSRSSWPRRSSRSS
jgi:hypothetical protein